MLSSHTSGKAFSTRVALGNKQIFKAPIATFKNYSVSSGEQVFARASCWTDNFWFAVKEEGRQANIDERLALKAYGFCTVGGSG